MSVALIGLLALAAYVLIVRAVYIQLSQSKQKLALATEELEKAQASLPPAGNQSPNPVLQSALRMGSEGQGGLYLTILLIQAMEQIHDDTKADLLLQKALQAMPKEFLESGVQTQDVRTILCLVHEFIHSNPDDFPDFQKRLDQFGAQKKLLLFAAGVKIMKEALSKLDTDDEKEFKEYYSLLKAAIETGLAANESSV